MWPEGSALPHTCANCCTQRSALAVIIRAMTLEQISPAIHFSSAMRLPRIARAMLGVVTPIYSSAMRLPLSRAMIQPCHTRANLAAMCLLLNIV